MADPDRLKKALRAAHAAGDTESAKRIARMIKAQSAPVTMPSERVVPAEPKPAGTDFVLGGYDPNKAAPESLLAGGLPAGIGGGTRTPDTAALAAEIGRRKQEAAANPANSALLGAAQTASLGFADEIGAAAISPFVDGSYSDVLGAIRGGNQTASAANPWAYLAGQVAGGVVPGAAILRPMAAPASLAGRVATGAGIGAGVGAIQGFGSGEGGLGNRLSGAESGAIGGAVLGGAFPVIGAGVRAGIDRLANSRAVKAALAAADTPEGLRDAAGRIYAQADQVENLPRGQFAAAVGDISETAARKGLDPDLTPGAAKVADRMATAAADESENIGFRELDILRRKAAIPAGNVANRTEQSIASEMVEGIDDFIETVDPSLSGAIKEARDMWGRLRRSDVVSDAIEKAKNTASGFENGLRIEFRKILNNPKILRGFNKREVEAIKRVVQGSTGGNLMRQVGRLGIGISGQSNAVGATMGGILGTTIGGPVGGLATVAGGTALKALSERSTRKAAENALATVLARNALDSIQPTQALPGVQNALSAIGFTGLPTAAPMVGDYILNRQ